jgi:hypothetical protein
VPHDGGIARAALPATPTEIGCLTGNISLSNMTMGMMAKLD